MSRSHRYLPALAAAGLVGLWASAASAQSGHIPDTSWRRGERTHTSEREATLGNFAFEVRFGPYHPEVDEEFGGTGPYSKVFDDDPQFYFGLELDWMPLRIPYVGVIGPGFGWGYTSTSRLALRSGCTPTDQDNCESGQETSLTIMPMHLSGVLRIDELMRRTGVPIVPYGKLGIGLGTWSSSAGSDTAKAGGVVGEDTTMGLHMALGAMLTLNFLERRSSATLYETTGVRHAALFGEWMNAQLDGFGGPKMHIGTSTWVVGLAFDM